MQYKQTTDPGGPAV